MGLLTGVPYHFSSFIRQRLQKTYLSKFSISLLFSKFHFWSMTAPHGCNVAVALSTLYNGGTDDPLT
jgi:hypothetical protein